MPLSTNDFVAIEEHVQSLWAKHKVFETIDDLQKNRPLFKFFDGPPFATGLPHYGHILASTIKDTVLRFYSQKRYKVIRDFGWDCHGLPVEYEIDKMHGFTREDIVKLGSQKYNDLCRQIVLKYTNEWKQTIKRLGRWCHYSYKTMDAEYMESCWRVFKVLFDRRLVYRGYRVMPYSTACTTPLSNFEANQNYKEVSDPCIIVKFKVNFRSKEASLLVFTTTPWTLPSNLGIAVNETFDYALVQSESEYYILLNERVIDYFSVESNTKNNIQTTGNKNSCKKNQSCVIMEVFKGKELVGLPYFPLFDNFLLEKWFKILHGDFIDASTGTGVVHCAPGFGEEDYNCFVKNKIIKMNAEVACPVDESGKLTIDPFRKSKTGDITSKWKSLSKNANISDSGSRSSTVDENTRDFCELEFENGSNFLRLKGVHVKNCDQSIIEFLKLENLVFKSDKLMHRYPFCWRSDTPLIYKAIPNWFIRVTDFTTDLVENNTKVSWVPESVSKKFGNWLENARDWSVSRNRFWGTPVPIWQHKNEFICVGSISELEKLSGVKVFNNIDKTCGKINLKKSLNNSFESPETYANTDIHRESVDDIVIVKDGKEFKRVEEVLDCWFESGSMPYYQKWLRHAPTSTSNSASRDFNEKMSLNKQINSESGDDSNIYHTSTDSFANFSKRYSSAVPALFIAEGIDQTRGWFYTLHALATMLFNTPAFKNVICNGIVLAEDGKKMSKRLKNYPDPSEILQKYGADSLRLCLLSSPVVVAENLLFNEERVKNIGRSVLVPLSNALKFYLDSQDSKLSDDMKNLSLNGNQADINKPHFELLMDEWILGRISHFEKQLSAEMTAFTLNNILHLITSFIENLNNWYIRINRDDIRNGKNTVLGQVLLRLFTSIAPFIPFYSEYAVQQILKKLRSIKDTCDIAEIKNLTIKTVLDKPPKNFISVHYIQFDPADLTFNNYFEEIKEIINGFRYIREQKGISLKTPLRYGIIISHSSSKTSITQKYTDIIIKECNLLELRYDEESKYKFQESWLPNFEAINKNKEKILAIRGMSLENVREAMEKGSVVVNLKNMQVKNTNKKKNKKKQQVGNENQENEVSEILETKDELITVLKEEILYKKNLESVDMPFKVAENFTLVLNTVLDDDLIKMKNAREFYSWLQKIRRQKGLKVEDHRKIFVDNRVLRDVVSSIYKQIEFVDDISEGTLDIEGSFEFEGKNVQVKLLK